MKIYGQLNKSCHLYWNGGKFYADKKIDGEFSELGTAWSCGVSFFAAQRVGKGLALNIYRRATPLENRGITGDKTQCPLSRLNIVPLSA